MRVAMSPLDNNCILTDRVGCISLLSQSKIAVKLKIKEIILDSIILGFNRRHTSKTMVFGR